MSEHGGSGLDPALRPIVERLLAESEDAREVHVDAIGEAIGTVNAGPAEIEAIFQALEAAGRTIVAPEGADLPAKLRAVLVATRQLATRLGRRPTLAEIAAESGLTVEVVRHALAFGRILGR